ncbi:MAG TPA: hypothetical protein VGS22_10290 [Thermoanaerobaculia bacterium]|jgi:hypothetical protein|nr:hypothetical protein [Thermoanaerobaculia bacterium]
MPTESTLPITLTSTFRTASKFIPAEQNDETSFQGHLSLQVDDAKEAGEGTRTLRISQFGAFSEGLETNQGNTGPISITELQGEGNVVVRDGLWFCQAAVTATVSYEAIEEAVGFVLLPPDLHISPPETFEGQLDLVLAVEPSTDDSQVMFSQQGRLHLVRASTLLGYVDELDITLTGLSFELKKAPPPTSASLTTRRTLRLQPIFFKSDAEDTNPSGTSWPAQLAGARRLWSNCCIDLETAQPLPLIDPDKKIERSSGRLRKGAARVDPNAIEVLFTTGDIGGGGGHTYSPGSARAVIVISDLYEANPYLLAHEIGHVLGAGHPGMAGAYGVWEPVRNTVMNTPKPGEANIPVNKISNCNRARNPLLMPTRTSCNPRDTVLT